MQKVFYTLSGKIIHGRALGRTVGMPTANLEITDGLVIPPRGVYASFITIDNTVFPSITNIGIRPTVDNDSLIKIETYIFDFNRDIYDKNVTVTLAFFLRDEKQFQNLDAVKKQVENDIILAKKLLEQISN